MLEDAGESFIVPSAPQRCGESLSWYSFWMACTRKLLPASSNLRSTYKSVRRHVRLASVCWDNPARGVLRKRVRKSFAPMACIDGDTSHLRNCKCINCVANFGTTCMFKRRCCKKTACIYIPFYIKIGTLIERGIHLGWLQCRQLKGSHGCPMLPTRDPSPKNVAAAGGLRALDTSRVIM